MSVRKYVSVYMCVCVCTQRERVRSLHHVLKFVIVAVVAEGGG